MPIRAEQVGSLLRPPDLLAARTAFADGRLDLASLRAKENESIRAAVERQRDIGLDVFVDGEMRRYSWLTGMADAVDGFLSDSVTLEWHGPGGGREATTAKIVGAPAAQARDADGERSAVHEVAGALAPRAVQGDGARAVELRADGIQARRHGSLLQGSRRPARRSRRHRPRRDRVARRSGRDLHPARRAVLLALSRSRAPAAMQMSGTIPTRSSERRSPATTRRSPAWRGRA